MDDGDTEEIRKGHASGRRIVAILERRQDDLDADDYEHMRRVNAYVARHLAQRPDRDVTNTPWRYSLMTWATTR